MVLGVRQAIFPRHCRKLRLAPGWRMPTQLSSWAHGCVNTVSACQDAASSCHEAAEGSCKFTADASQAQIVSIWLLGFLAWVHMSALHWLRRPSLLPAHHALPSSTAYYKQMECVQMIGWAEKGACRLYTPGNGEAAMAYLAPSIPLGDADAPMRLASTAFKALKLAGQFCRHDSFGLVSRVPSALHGVYGSSELCSLSRQQA